MGAKQLKLAKNLPSHPPFVNCQIDFFEGLFADYSEPLDIHYIDTGRHNRNDLIKKPMALTRGNLHIPRCAE